MNEGDVRAPGRFYTPAEAAATNLVSPALTALLAPLGGVFLGLATAALVLWNSGDWQAAATALLLWLVLGSLIGGLRLIGVFDLVVWLARYRQELTAAQATATPPAADSAELARNPLAELFTEDGLVAFVQEVIYRQRKWTVAALVPHVISRHHYDLLFNDILVKVGVLAAERATKQTRPLAPGADGQPLTFPEAERRIRGYLNRPSREIWKIDIGGGRNVHL